MDDTHIPYMLKKQRFLGLESPNLTRLQMSGFSDHITPTMGSLPFENQQGCQGNTCQNVGQNPFGSMVSNNTSKSSFKSGLNRFVTSA